MKTTEEDFHFCGINALKRFYYLILIRVAGLRFSYVLSELYDYRMWVLLVSLTVATLDSHQSLSVQQFHDRRHRQIRNVC